MAAAEKKQLGMPGQWPASESSPASWTALKPLETGSITSEASREYLLRTLTPSASTRGEESCAESLAPLLKASPPIPVGRLPGRYKVKLWRSTADQPLGLALGLNSSGITVMAKDAPHFGFRAGDEVLSVNGCAIQDLRQCGQLLEGSQELELHLYHKEGREHIQRGAGLDEMKDLQAAPHIGSDLCWTSTMACEPQAMPECCDAFFNPPEPRCKASEWPLRELLSISGPFTMPGDGSIFRLHLARTSLRQPFGLQLGVLSLSPQAGMSSELSAEGLSRTTCALPLSESFASSQAEPDWAPREVTCEEVQPEVVLMPHGQRENLLADVPSRDLSREPTAESASSCGGPVVVLASMPYFGLHQGDELLTLNGIRIRSLGVCKMVLKRSMNITLELRRPSPNSPVVAANFILQRNASSQGANSSPARRIEDWQSVTSDTKDFSGLPDVAEPASEGWFGGFLSSLQTAFCSETVRVPVDSFAPDVSRMPTEVSHGGRDIVQVANF